MAPSAKAKRDKRKQQLKNRREAEEAVHARAATSLVEDEEATETNVVLAPAVDATGAALEERAAKFQTVELDPEQALQLEEERKRAEAEEAEKNRVLVVQGDGEVKREKLWRLHKGAEELGTVVGPRMAPLVSQHDANAQDPYFLVLLKGIRNTVPVPKHWEFKRAYLAHQTNRERGDYVVPKFIADTGVKAIRGDSSLAGIGFSRKLQSAFSNTVPGTQQKTKLSAFGRTYYEGKDLRGLRHNFVPGEMSAALRKALGMNSETSPPPWLIAQQRLKRLPPSYPDLKIPGLNAPPPPGGHWGEAVGLWGTPARHPDGSLVFPAVLDPPNKSQKVSAGDYCARYWGRLVPAYKKPEAEEEEAENSATAIPEAAAAPAAPAPAPASFIAAAIGKGAIQQPGSSAGAAAVTQQQQWATEYQRQANDRTGSVMAPSYLYVEKK